MNNYILLEGIEIYVFVFLLLTLVAIGLIGIITGIKHDVRYDRLRGELEDAELKLLDLNRENMRLKLKHGELKVGEKVDI